MSDVYVRHETVETYPTSWKPTTKTSAAKQASMSAENSGAKYVHTLVGKEVHATDGFFDLQALLHLARLDIPEADSLVIRPANETLA